MSGAEQTEDQVSPRGYRLLSSGLMWLAIGVAVAVGVVRILTHHPFYDECLHVHKLWLLSSGLEPHLDFWCNYPVLGYVLTLPVLAVLPQAAWGLLALRFLMLPLILAAGFLMGVHGRRTGDNWIWGCAPVALILITPPLGRFLAEYSIDHFAMLSAVGAIVLFFTRPRPFRLGSAAALCLLSVLLTPKYALPLFFGLLGYAAAGVFTARRVIPSIVAIGAGAVAAALLAQALYGLGGTSPVLNVQYAHLFMAEFKLAADSAPVSLASSTLQILLRNLPLLALVIAGLVGFSKWVRGRLSRGLAPLGLLAGALASAILTKTYMVQYILPVIVCLAAFVPFARRLATSAATSRLLTPAVALATLGSAAVALIGATSEFEQTPINVRDTQGLVAEHVGLDLGPPAIESLRATQRLLDLIPPGEKVIAPPQWHPLFRRDLTFITADERPSFSTVLERDDPARQYFAVSHIFERLTQEAPAYIRLTGLEFVYPPGWVEMIVEFLRRNERQYVRLEGYPDGYLRIDLLE